MKNIINCPIKLNNAHNTRELGGYEGQYGVTATKVFLRSDSLANLDEHDITTLLNYGVKTIVDLRSAFEVGNSPFKISERLNYYNVPMFDNVNSHDFVGVLPDSMGETYLYLLEEAKIALKQIFEYMLLNKDRGVILFNCTAGKDRTGIVAMLLLKLAGIDDATIINDYKTSGDNNKLTIESEIKRLNDLNIKVKENLFYSYKEDMECALKHVNEKYQSIENYLFSIGLNKGQINNLKAMLIRADK